MLKNFRLLHLILALVMTLSSFTSSAASSAFLIRGLSFAKLQEAGIQSIRKSITPEGKVLYEFLDGSSDVTKRLEFGRAGRADWEELRPSKLRRYFQELKANGGKAAIDKVKLANLAPEVFAFFVALGALAVKDLVFNYNDDPLAIEHFLNGQKDPVGQIGFAAFMMANGVAAEPLMAVVESKAARFAIPYFGMSVGMVASNITSEVLRMPGLAECAAVKSGQSIKQAVTGPLVLAVKIYNKTVEAPAKIDACDKAYDAWMKFSFSEKGHEWAPGLFAMIASTFAASLVEWGAEKIATFVGIELVMKALPSGWAVSGLRWSYKVAKIAGFMYLQSKFETPLKLAWKNAIQYGPPIKASIQTLGVLALRKLTYGWNPETGTNRAGQPACKEPLEKNCFLDLDLELQNFQSLMAKWREAHLDSVSIASNNWQELLFQMSAEYRMSKKFYIDFVSDLWKKKFQSAPGFTPLMDRALPLYGVTPKGLGKGEESMYLQRPSEIQDMQLETIHDVAHFFAQFEDMKPFLRGLSPASQQLVNSILATLVSNDVQKIGQALQEIRYHLAIDPSSKVILDSAELAPILRPLFKALGNPKPLWEPGQGYLRLMAQDPNSPIYQKNPFPLDVPTEYLARQMVFGPDIEEGEKLIDHSLPGLPLHFKAPMIRVRGNYQLQERKFSERIPDDVKKSIFRVRFAFDGWGQMTDQGSIFDFLRNEGVRPEIVGDAKGHQIQQWWEKYPEQDFASTWLSYENNYQDIIQDLHGKLFDIDAVTTIGNYQTTLPDRLLKATNSTPVSNGVLSALEEERSVYIYLLDSMLQTLNSQKTDVLPKAENNFYSILEPAKKNQDSNQPWTKNLLQEWTHVRELLGRLEQKTVFENDGKKTYVVSHVTNSEIEEQIKKLDQIVDDYRVIPSCVLMTDYQNKVAQMALKGLKDSQQELQNYAEVINNVSYVAKISGKNGAEIMKRRCQKTSGSSGLLKAQSQGCNSGDGT